MDEELINNFRKARVTSNAKNAPLNNNFMYEDPQQMMDAKILYSNRVYENQRLECVMFLDGPVTEQNTLLLRLQLHEFIRLKAVSDEYIKPSPLTQPVYQIKGKDNMFFRQDPEFLVPPYIILSIRSPGGDMIAAMALCSVIKTVQKLGIPVIGIVNGIAYSAGFMIMTACQYRYMLPHSHAMSHEAKTGISGTMTGLKYKQVMLDDYEDMGLESLLDIESDIAKSEGFEYFLKNEYPLYLESQQIKKKDAEEPLVYFVKNYVELPSVDNFLRFTRAKYMGLIHGVITEGVYAKLLSCPYSPNRHVELSGKNIDRIFNEDASKVCVSELMNDYQTKIKGSKPNFFDPNSFPVIEKIVYPKTYAQLPEYKNPRSALSDISKNISPEKEVELEGWE